MASDQNGVKIEERGYHHGALRQALLAAAEDVLAERGTHGFSLRETARRAGVSPSAPAHHFKDTRGLLTALATSAFAELADALAAAAAGEGTRESRIAAQGIAYVRFAMARRARFDLMWRAALVDHEDPSLAEASFRAFHALDRAVRGDAALQRGDPMGVETAPSIAAWSLVHGFVRLAIDGAFGTQPAEVERAVAGLLPRMFDHLVV